MSEERVLHSEFNLSDSKKPTGKTHSAQKSRAFLGIICLLLLAVLALRYIDFQASHQNQNNDIQEDGISSVENNCFSKVQSNPENYREAYKDKWFCCGKKCYYFSYIHKNFEESRKFCNDISSQLVKIEDKDELDFIQSLASYFHWIGLSRKGYIWYWMWEDGSLMHYDLALEDTNGNTNDCACVTTSKLVATLCNRKLLFICEKNSPNLRPG